MRYRILMIAPTSFFADYGCHVRILEEIVALQSRGHAVRLCTYHNGKDLPDIDIRRTIDVPVVKRPVVGSSRHKAYLDMALFFETARQAVAFKPDIIHAHLHEGALIGSFVARTMGLPVVFDYQGSLTEEMLDHGFVRGGGKREWFFRRLERFIDRQPAMLVPSSIAGEQYLRATGVDARRICPIPDAVNVDRFDPAIVEHCRPAIRERLGIPHDAAVVIYLGLLAEYQGTPLLIDAARELLTTNNDVYFVVGGYPAVGRHAQMARDMPVANHVLFPGRISFDDAPAFLAAGDVGVAPKMSATEGNGKVLNYMAMGLPVVAIESALNRNIVGDRGHFVPPNDPMALARAINDALFDGRDVRESLRSRVEKNFSWDECVMKLEAVYDGLLMNRSLPEPSATKTFER